MTLAPISVRSGEKIAIRVAAPVELAGSEFELVLISTDPFETSWLSSMSGRLDEHGECELGFDIELDGPAVCEVAGFNRRLPDQDTAVPVASVTSSRLALNPGIEIKTIADVDRLYSRLKAAQEALYASPIGARDATGSIEHRAICLVERLLLTRPLKLPGVELLPVLHSVGGIEEHTVVQNLIREVGWPTQIDRAQWSRQVSSNRPWLLLKFNSIWASGFDEAAHLVWQSRDRIAGSLAISRNATAENVVTIIEQHQPTNRVASRIYHEDRPYKGNLIGGTISGESQHALLAHLWALEKDPLLELCVDLFADAQSERDEDFKYLKLWSTVETLARAKISAGQEVVCLNGESWGGPHGTTSSAQPLVYELLASRFRLGGIDEFSSFAPAANLREAVGVWYARRNATAHYGRFDAESEPQSRQQWFKRALLTLDDAAAASSFNSYLGAFERAVSADLQARLWASGRARLRTLQETLIT